MRKKLVILGLILLVLAGFPLILRILGGFSNRFPNGVPSGEPQIPIVMTLLGMGLLSLSSMGIMMGIIITVIGAVSPPSKKPDAVALEEAEETVLATTMDEDSTLVDRSLEDIGLEDGIGIRIKCVRRGKRT